MARRTRAREVALQVLYQDDLNPRHNPDDDQRFVEGRLQAPELIEFARSLISGVRRNRQELDDLLSQTADHWSLERMALVDRNILRIAIFELLYLDDIPAKVTLNEAIEIAKRYGDESSSAFINGILDRILCEEEKMLAKKVEVQKSLNANQGA